MPLNTMVGFFLSRTLPKCIKMPFSPFLGKKLCKNDMGIKIGFFYSTEYVGVVECSLKPLPSEIISFIDIFLEIKFLKNVNK